MAALPRFVFLASCRAIVGTAEAFDSGDFQAFNEKKYMHLIDSYRDTDGSRRLINETVDTYKAVYTDMGILK